MADLVLPADLERAEEYKRVNPKDQPLKFLHQDGSVTESQSVAVTDSVLPDGAATEAKQDSLALYKTQVLDDYTTTDVSYVCKMKPDGTWLFMKIDETGSFPTYTYANVSNNLTKTTYALAYASRVSLTYGLLNTLILT